MTDIHHYEICSLLYMGNIKQAQELFCQKIKGQKLSPTMRNTFLSSLNFAIYHYIFFHENVSLDECCLENEQRIAHAKSDAFLETGLEIIASYGMDKRYLIAKHQNPHIQNAVSYIHTHLNEPLTLETVSSAICMNKNYLCQLFLKEVGISFGSYICTQRLNLAKRLLENTSLSIQEIGQKCGFQTTSYFCTCFKHTFGTTPGKLRKTMRNC